MGGEVSAGVTIYNRLRALQNKKSVIIEGLAASIASIISMAGDEIHMTLGSEMMIHNPSSYAFGEADDFEKAAESLRKTKENLIDIYEARTGLTREEIATMMDDETWLTAREALEKGFCTSVDESLQMVACRKGTDLIVNGLPMSMDVLKGLPVDKFEEKGEEPMEVTAELLRTDYAEVYDEVFNAGVAAERARLQALDGINNEARAEVINRAKYETYATVQDVAVELLNMPQPEQPTKRYRLAITGWASSACLVVSKKLVISIQPFSTSSEYTPWIRNNWTVDPCKVSSILLIRITRCGYWSSLDDSFIFKNPGTTNKGFPFTCASSLK